MAPGECRHGPGKPSNYDSAASRLQSKLARWVMIRERSGRGTVMKLKFESVIDADLDTVWAAFENPDNMPRWQQNLESFRHISGQAGQPGAISELVYDEKGKRVILKQTITERRQPDFIASTYESPMGKTLIVNHFEAIDDESTRWTAWCNFTFQGFMKIMSLFVSGVIRKRTEGDMQRFKLMVETDHATVAS